MNRYTFSFSLERINQLQFNYVRLCTDVLLTKQTEQEMMMFIYATAVHGACFKIDAYSLDVSSARGRRHDSCWSDSTMVGVESISSRVAN